MTTSPALRSVPVPPSKPVTVKEEQTALPAAPRRGAQSSLSAAISRRRRRPTLWDVRTPQYGIHVPTPHGAAPGAPAGASALGGSLHGGRGGPRAGDGTTGWLGAAGATAAAAAPAVADVVRPLPQGETDPLAAIDIPALRKLLAGSSGARPDGVPGAGGLAATATAASQPFGGGTAAANALGAAAAAVIAAPNDAPKLVIPGEQNMQTTRNARRLYVGNLPTETTELQIGDFFNRALIASGGSESGDEPVISVYINLEKRFAFIETRTVREAAAGLALDGVKFRDMFLRVRRPKDFIGSADSNVTPLKGFNPSILGIVSTQVADGPNKMFIGGIPYTLAEDQIKGLLQTYGALAAFNLIKDPGTGQSKGFAFFEYVDGSVVDAACEGLHGMQVGDKTLTVRRATNSGTDTPGATFASGLLRAPSGPSAASGVTFSANALVKEPTKVVLLDNILGEEDLGDNAEFESNREDIEEEGKLFGVVEEIFIPRPGDAKLEESVGQAYLRYGDVDEAYRARVTLDGRRFGDRVVTASFFDEQRFAKREL